MAVPAVWSAELLNSRRRPSAVAIILLTHANNGTSAQQPSILLIRRSVTVSTHRGQIGFPGGRLEPGDAGPLDTALREAYEEVGLAPNSVTVLGAISSIRSIDASLVYGIVGLSSMDPQLLTLNHDEVASIHLIPLSSVSVHNRRKFKFNLFGCWRHSFLYDCGDISVWGLSAEILAKIDFKTNIDCS